MRPYTPLAPDRNRDGPDAPALALKVGQYPRDGLDPEFGPLSRGSRPAVPGLCSRDNPAEPPALTTSMTCPRASRFSSWDHFCRRLAMSVSRLLHPILMSTRTSHRFANRGEPDFAGRGWALPCPPALTPISTERRSTGIEGAQVVERRLDLASVVHGRPCKRRMTSCRLGNLQVTDSVPLLGRTV
jgi:hypothetical protein